MNNMKIEIKLVEKFKKSRLFKLFMDNIKLKTFLKRRKFRTKQIRTAVSNSDHYKTK